VQFLSIALFIGGLASSAQAQTVTLARDIDLVTDNGLVHYSQTDGRWAYFSMRGDPSITIGQCGCLLSAFATVINQQGGMVPWFPTPFNYFGGSDGAWDFNPRYLDRFFSYGPNASGAPPPPGSLSYPTNWGYKSRPPGTCGVIPLLQALQTVGTDGLGSAVGFTPKVHDGFGPDVKDIVNRNLLAGRPTIAAIRVGNESTVANHAVLIAGWDNDEKAYRILDPMKPRFGIHGPTRPQVEFAIDPGDSPADATYLKYEMRIEGIIEMRTGGFSGSRPSFIVGDDPSPIEILMTGPDGRRTGVNPENGTSFDDNDAASYWTFGPWIDPLGEVQGGVAPRFVTFPNAPAGTYHFKVTGTADGALQFAAETLFGGTRVLLGEFGGTIAAGEVRKYELQFSRTGPSAIAQVSNFTPHAYAGDDLHARTDAAITFDGRRSFDADGAIASFEWDFGDGATAVGSQPQHVYTVPGDYLVTLTVTDANGVTATDSLQADVILSQRRPVANASGPYLGFASTSSDWYVLLDARGSSDPNGDPLTYRWDFGDASPIRTTSAGFADHVYAATGVYTMTVVVNDGIEDSAPATARVEIVQVPGNRLTHSDAVLTPHCGLPGDTVTIVMGEFAQFQWWNFGTMGALPQFPPQSLGLGLSAPPGMMRVFLLVDGGPLYLPFHATLLSPGRFIAGATFTVPDVAPGLYGVGWAEEDSLPFQVPCPVPSNRAPLADAGGPYTGGVGSPITFDGSASSDPDGDALEYEWDFGDGASGEGVRPVHSYVNEGRYLVTLIVSDGQRRSAAAPGTRSFTTATVTTASLDTIPPVTTAVNAPPVNVGGWNTTDVAVNLSAVDNLGGSGVRNITFALSGAETDGATVPGHAAQVVVTREGITDLAYFATDNAGNREVPQHRVVRIDRAGPTITGMPSAACSLWPPNHKLVTIAQVSASDGVSGMAPEGLVLTATSSEPEDALGDGNTGPDIVITGGSVALRAERSGTGVGRTYRITATATDRAGNTTRAESVCAVPHDQRPVR
jgi:PKD repeat protein